MHFYAANLNFHCILQVTALWLVLDLWRGELRHGVLVMMVVWKCWCCSWQVPVCIWTSISFVCLMWFESPGFLCYLSSRNRWRNIMLAGCFPVFKRQICFAFCVVLHVLISWHLNNGSVDIRTRMKKQQPSASMLSVFPSVSELFETAVYLCKQSFWLYLGIVHGKERTEMRLL
jgi:hypothetical protein